MANLSITSVTYHELDNPAGRPAVEISGEWTGDNQPPRILKNVYKDDEDHLMQDIFHKTEESYSISNALVHGLTANPQYAANYRWVVSYRFVDSLNITPVEIVSDFVFGQNKDEYVAWNLLARQIS